VRKTDFEMLVERVYEDGSCKGGNERERASAFLVITSDGIESVDMPERDLADFRSVQRCTVQSWSLVEVEERITLNRMKVGEARKKDTWVFEALGFRGSPALAQG
jgi:hypothetical protein